MTLPEQVFAAAALLHREHPGRAGFKGHEILRKVREIDRGERRDSTINAHIYLHCVANKKPNSATHRILTRNADGTFRLYREGDDCHPDRRNGKTAPGREAFPARYRKLVDWYRTEYSTQQPAGEQEDPILALRGLGKELWRKLGGVAFIESLRTDWYGPEETAERTDQPARRIRRAG
ncbi:MAG: hypothetical protein HY238_24380 [Acidobacteria bacterium]|nr:hypothetical protein [Acidobacteriota bacterium]